MQVQAEPRELYAAIIGILLLALEGMVAKEEIVLYFVLCASGV